MPKGNNNNQTKGYVPAMYALVDADGHLAVKKSGKSGTPVFQTYNKAEGNARHWKPKNPTTISQELETVKYTIDEEQHKNKTIVEVSDEKRAIST